MADRYFENFPNLRYPRYRDGEVGNRISDQTVLMKDISRRATISASKSKSPFLFYPYELNDQLRSDHISEYYYGDPNLEWLILMSNQIIDPYYGWYNTDDTFEQSIIEKYQSTAHAKSKVKFYINNWADDDTQISVGFHNDNLVQSLRKYWTPVYGPALNITSYKRKEDDIVMNTNQILAYGISANNNATALTTGELVNVKATGTEAIIGSGEVEMSNSTVIRIKNISGTTAANSTAVKDIVGWDSLANVSVNSSNTWYENISNTEFVYYTAMYYYDWETELNEQRKTMLLIGDANHGEYTSKFEELLNEDTDPETGLSNG